MLIPHRLTTNYSSKYSDTDKLSSSERSLKYRPDIDGLRAIAVISVVLFHAFPESIFKSGFTGVDIFFVISGFLISTILFKGMAERANPTEAHKPFSFWGFYSRRIRRIFPSLIFCLTTFLVLGWLYMLPDEYSLLGKHTMGAAGYVSNLVLWSEAGDYFQTASQTKPLLHLWSLGIEEQFYLVWPALLFISWKLRLNIITFALLGALASFGFEVHVVRMDPSTAFYSPLLRFWELMAGSILAWLKLYQADVFKKVAERTGTAIVKVLFARDGRKRDPAKVCADAISLLGLALILISIFGLNAKHFPGSKALYPVLGATFMIAAGKEAFFNRVLLSNRVMVWLGLISYPLYIWHWPFLSLCWIFSGSLPDLKVRIGCVIASIVMAAVTYYLVEPHLRWGKHGNAKALGLLCTMLAIGFCGYEIWHHNGYPIRIKDPKLVEIQRIQETFNDAQARCGEYIPDWKEYGGPNQCKFSKDGGQNSIAVIGDSHAGHLYPGLVGKGISVAVFPASCAIPLIGLSSGASDFVKKRGPDRKHSSHLIDEGFRYILTHRNLTKVLMVHSPGCSNSDLIDLINRQEKNHDRILINGFERTLKALSNAGKQIYIVLDNPVYSHRQSEECRSVSVSLLRPHKLPNILSPKLKQEQVCSIQEHLRPDRRPWNKYTRIAKEISKNYSNVKFIDLSEFLCKDGTCSMVDKNGRLLYEDNQHLNIEGSLFVAPEIIKSINTP